MRGFGELPVDNGCVRVKIVGLPRRCGGGVGVGKDVGRGGGEK